MLNPSFFLLDRYAAVANLVNAVVRSEEVRVRVSDDKITAINCGTNDVNDSISMTAISAQENGFFHIHRLEEFLLDNECKFALFHV